MTDQYISGIMLALGVFMLGMFTPGPNILAVIGTSMSTGRRAGQALALGVATGSLLWGSLTLFGLTAVIALYAEVMEAIKVAGAGYLLWLAFKAFRSAALRDEAPLRALAVAGGLGAYYRRGVIVQMTNAKAALLWIAIMSLAMDGHAPMWVGASVVVGTAVLSALGHQVYALAFSTAPMVAAYRRARRCIEGALGVYFCFAGYKLLTYRN